jgi:hypothetical protein
MSRFLPLESIFRALSFPLFSEAGSLVVPKSLPLQAAKTRTQAVCFTPRHESLGTNLNQGPRNLQKKFAETPDEGSGIESSLRTRTLLGITEAALARQVRILCCAGLVVTEGDRLRIEIGPIQAVMADTAEPRQPSAMIPAGASPEQRRVLGTFF